MAALALQGDREAWGRRIHSALDYFDLSNQQLFLGRRKRISKRTLEDWKEGIAGNCQLPAFEEAWEGLVEHLSESDFEDLRGLPKPYRKTEPLWVRLKDWLVGR